MKEQFKNILTLKRGYDLPISLRVKGDFPVISSNGITDWHAEAKIEGPGVITGRSGTIGKVIYSNNIFWPLNTTLYVSDFKGNNPKYIYYMLSTLSLEKYSTGSAVPTLNRNHLDTLYVPYHSPLLQQHIVDTIGSIDDKIESNNKLIESIIRLGDNTILNINEEEYLINLANIKLGGTPSRNIDEYWIGENKWLNSGSLTNTPVITDANGVISDTAIKNSSTKFGNARDTLVSIMEPSVQKISLLSDEFYFNQSIICLTSGDVIASGSIFFGMRNAIEELAQKKSGSAQQSLNKNQFTDLKIKYSTQYSKYFNDLINIMINISKENKKLDQLKQLYLKKFFG